MSSSEESLPLKGTSQSSGKKKEEYVEDDDLYCLKSSFIYFQAERGMFHVPSHRFIGESHVFAGMFNLPQTNTSDVEGMSRENPIVLPNNIQQSDFRNFMKALYPLTASIRLTLTKQEWISVLRLSTFWYFLAYRSMAISELENGKELTSCDKIVYGREFKVRSWVEQGFTELVNRTDTIGKEEAVAVDYETVFALFRIREKHIRAMYGGFDTSFAVIQAFSDELATLSSFESEYKIDVAEVELQAVSDPPTSEPVTSPFGSGSGGRKKKKKGMETAPSPWEW